VARFKGSSDQTAVDCTNKINEPYYKTPENFSGAEGLDSVLNFPTSSKELKREVGIRPFFVREKNLQGTATMYTSVIACLRSLITHYASRMKKVNNCTETGLTPLR
jgi:hypothetical protein